MRLTRQTLLAVAMLLLAALHQSAAAEPRSRLTSWSRHRFWNDSRTAAEAPGGGG